MAKSKTNRPALLLNLAALGGFALYATGIYLDVTVLGRSWGNLPVRFVLRLGPAPGCILVLLTGALILFATLWVDRLRALNVFLCWFWIFSLYQCAANSFLNVAGHPDEPVNRFFKSCFPSLWYPAKELVFVSISIPATVCWIRATWGKTRSPDRVDALLVGMVAAGAVLVTLMSQVLLMNAGP